MLPRDDDQQLRESTGIRIRVGQKYLEAGHDHKPDLVRVEVVTIDPLTVKRERWTGYDSHEAEPYDDARLRSLPLVFDPDLNADELREVLVGRRIVAIEVDQQTGDWPQGRGDTTLTLDDGRTVAFRSWGYDANGMNASIDPPLGS